MNPIKDTKRATVHVTYDGRVHKQFHGPHAQKRYQNERLILQHLQKNNCPFVPKLLNHNDTNLTLTTTNCGAITNKISTTKLNQLFQELETYGIRHGDPYPRNITYNPHLGRFCIIDFEFATIIQTGQGLTIQQLEQLNKNQQPTQTQQNQQNQTQQPKQNP